MRFGYVHCPRFPIQRWVRDAPSLAKRPLVLVREERGLRKVVFASMAAWREGIRTGMTLTAASALEPQLVWLPYDLSAEKKALSALGEALLSCVPGFELDAPEGLWLDASASKLCGGEASWARRVLEVCREQGYLGQMAVASQKFTAQALATYSTGPRIECVEVGTEQQALAALPLEALGNERVETLARALGLSTLGEVASLPAESVAARWGGEGVRAHRCCRGQDESPLAPDAPTETLDEGVQLDWPAESIEPVLFAFKTAVDRLCARLSARALAAIRLTFHLGLDPRGDTHFEVALARPTAEAKMILELARHSLMALSLPNPVASVWVAVDEHGPARSQQRVLGEGPQGDAALEVVLSRLASSLGKEVLFSTKVLPAHRPEAAMTHSGFSPPDALERLAPTENASVSGLRPMRLLAVAQSLSTKLSSEGRLISMAWEGKDYEVKALLGPERLCGEWWTSSSFGRDYYRAFLADLGWVWLFRDLEKEQFFLHGFFD